MLDAGHLGCVAGAADELEPDCGMELRLCEIGADRQTRKHISVDIAKQQSQFMQSYSRIPEIAVKCPLIVESCTSSSDVLSYVSTSVPRGILKCLIEDSEIVS